MNRRTALSITFIALNLMACTCGGVGQQAPKPPIQPVNAGDGVAVAEKKSDPVNLENPIQKTQAPAKTPANAEQEIRSKYAADLVSKPIPEANPKYVTSAPNETKKLKSSVDNVTVEVVNIAIDRLEYVERKYGKFTPSTRKATDHMLILKLKITNGMNRTLFYTPWHTTTGGSP